MPPQARPFPNWTALQRVYGDTEVQRLPVAGTGRRSRWIRRSCPTGQVSGLRAGNGGAWTPLAVPVQEMLFGCDFLAADFVHSCFSVVVESVATQWPQTRAARTTMLTWVEKQDSDRPPGPVAKYFQSPGSCHGTDQWQPVMRTVVRRYRPASPPEKPSPGLRP